MVNAPAVIIGIKDADRGSASVYRRSMYRVRMHSPDRRITLKVTRRLAP
jgi:hypothetical protein